MKRPKSDIARRLAWLAVACVFGSTAACAAEATANGMKPAPVVSWRDARKHVGEYCCVEGRIRSAKNIGRMCFLNFGRRRGDFTVVIFAKFYDAFPQPPEKLYRGKNVRVWGYITTYKDTPELMVFHPVQIQAAGVSVPSLAPPKARRIRIAQYNVHNLFDGIDDPYTADEGRNGKPLAVPKEDLNALCKMIREQIRADILGLEEVENRGFLRKIVRERLSDLGYKHVVLVEANDSTERGRGIDVALLSRFPVGAVTSFQNLEFRDALGIPRRFARDALRVEVFPRPDFKLVVYVLHLKSRLGGMSAQVWRNAEAAQVRKLVDADLKRRERVVVMGDFNDDPKSDTLKILTASNGPHPLLRAPVKAPDGSEFTHFSHHYPPIVFDYILLSRGLYQRLVPGKARILTADPAAKASDHRPVVVELDFAPR